MHGQSLKEHFQNHPPMNAAQAVNDIERLTGVKRSPSRVKEWMKKAGMRFRKMGSVPKGAEEIEKQKEQEDFLKKNSNPRFERQKMAVGWFYS